MTNDDGALTGLDTAARLLDAATEERMKSDDDTQPPALDLEALEKLLAEPRRYRFVLVRAEFSALLAAARERDHLHVEVERLEGSLAVAVEQRNVMRAQRDEALARVPPVRFFPNDPRSVDIGDD